MTTERSVDERISAWLLESAPEQLPDRVLTATFKRTRGGRQRRTLPGWRPFAMRRTTTTALAVGATAIVLVVVGVNLPQLTNPSVVGGPSLTPSTSATVPTTSPTLAPTLAPTPTTALLIWTQASLNEDWPAPVRAEPAGGATVFQNGVPAVYPDPVGDINVSSPWVDIRELHGTFIGLAERPTPVNPAERWIAYGIVVDTDRDGAPDLRFGIDNIRVTASGEQESRAWVTDLHTGRTTIDLPPGEDDGAAGFYASWPGEGHGIGCVFASPLPSGATGPCREPLEMLTGAHLSFGGDLTGGGHYDNLRSPFYTWASVIEDGRVVATDYAPDVGWLDPSAEAKR